MSLVWVGGLCSFTANTTIGDASVTYLTARIHEIYVIFRGWLFMI